MTAFPCRVPESFAIPQAPRFALLMRPEVIPCECVLRHSTVVGHFYANGRCRTNTLQHHLNSLFLVIFAASFVIWKLVVKLKSFVNQRVLRACLFPVLQFAIVPLVSIPALRTTPSKPGLFSAVSALVCIVSRSNQLRQPASSQRLLSSRQTNRTIYRGFSSAADERLHRETGGYTEDVVDLCFRLFRGKNTLLREVAKLLYRWPLSSQSPGSVTSSKLRGLRSFNRVYSYPKKKT